MRIFTFMRPLYNSGDLVGFCLRVDFYQFSMLFYWFDFGAILFL
ncbi:hypothetical protein D1AOALGA4SA_10647 [Olavius algarvensis Delta 1 endosymbiont]|nr:hypothetical protein D1AOALGA4SA_10647 [Olavius algarvensis Delta 1 endosymbiont]